MREYYYSDPVIGAVQHINANDARVFFKFDVCHGYHQIELAEDRRDYTTFLTPYGYASKEHPTESTPFQNISADECQRRW